MIRDEDGKHYGEASFKAEEKSEDKDKVAGAATSGRAVIFTTTSSLSSRTRNTSRGTMTRAILPTKLSRVEVRKGVGVIFPGRGEHQERRAGGHRVKTDQWDPAKKGEAGAYESSHGA